MRTKNRKHCILANKKQKKMYYVLYFIQILYLSISWLFSSACVLLFYFHQISM